MSTADHDTTVRQSFDQQTRLFTGDRAPFAGRASATLPWLEPLTPDLIVLDVACGAGHVAEQAAPRVRQVVGVDLTPSLLRLAADRLGAAGITNVLLQEGRATRLPFVDASFDLVFSRAALHHFPHPDAAAAEMARVCRPGGRVVVSDMIAPGPEVREAFDALHRKLDPSHASALLPAELAAVLRTVGPLTRNDVANPSRLPIELIMTDAADRDAVLADLRAEIAGGPTTGFGPAVEDGQLTVSFTTAVVEAVREVV